MIFTVACGKTYKTERGFEIHLNSNCGYCKGEAELYRVTTMFTSKIVGGNSMDISRKQVKWLMDLVYKTSINISSYTRTSRSWFDVQGPEFDDRNFGVVVWPNGAGFISKHMNWEEECEVWLKDKWAYQEKFMAAMDAVDAEDDMEEMRIKYEGAK